MNKEECEKSLNILKEQYEYLEHMMKANYPFTIEMLENSYRCFEQLYKEHFEFLEVLKECGWGELTPADLRVVIKAGQYNAKQLNELRNQEPLNFEEYEKEIAFLVSTIDKMAETLATVSGFFDKEEIKNRYYYSSADGECEE